MTAGKLAEASPTQALQWLQSLTGLEQKQISSSFSKVIDAWAKQDPYAAGTWLGQNAAHPQYDTMATQYAQMVAGVDPKNALAWAQTVGDTDARSQSLMEVARVYLRQEPESAVPALLAAGFSQEMITDAKAQQNAVSAMATAEEQFAKSQFERLILTRWLSGEVETVGSGEQLLRLDGSVFRHLDNDAAYITWKDPSVKNPHGIKFQDQSCVSCHSSVVSTK